MVKKIQIPHSSFARSLLKVNESATSLSSIVFTKSLPKIKYKFIASFHHFAMDGVASPAFLAPGESILGPAAAPGLPGAP